MKDKKRKKAVDAKFWIKECAELTQMKEMVDRGLILKHDSILKALACATTRFRPYYYLTLFFNQAGLHPCCHTRYAWQYIVLQHKLLLLVHQ
jgi:hypothetical protein